MLIAIDHNNNRIYPTKGRTGICQLCRNEVRAYCGEINIDHWRHSNLSLCDSWKESESDWHREWKNEFPKDWQEVIIEENYEKHIADIRTPNGLVLELQNSSISSTTIKIRERFYGNIVWLINANNFKDNFIIWSLVKSRLKQLDDEHRQMYNFNPNIDSFAVEKLKDKCRDIEAKIRDKSWKLSSSISDLKEIDLFENEIESKTREYITSKYSYFGVLSEFKSESRSQFAEIKEKISKANEAIEKNQSVMQQIDNFKSCEINGYQRYKHATADQISPAFFSKCILIEKGSEDGLFPNTLTLKSEQEFRQVGRNPKFILLVNLDEKVERIQATTDSIKQQIDEYENEQQTLIIKTGTEIKSYLDALRKSVEIERDELKLSLEVLNHKLSAKKAKIISVKEIEAVEQNEMFARMEKQHTNDRYNAMKRLKGLYSYNWKHRRKSWDYSERKIYLDFENAIFEIVNENTLRKIDKKTFLEIIQNWQCNKSFE